MSRHRFSRARRAGFTIVELAIVLAAIGILLTGILKGQELINGAKIRAIADRQNSLRIAWFEFVDHYGAKPGDFARAGEFIAHVTPIVPNPNTLGNGLVEEVGESVSAMEHLTLAGLLRCQQCADRRVSDADDDPKADSMPDADNSPTNQYDGVISIWHDDANYELRGGNMGVRRLQIHTGPRIPSNILAEVDRKIDDGLANSGGMVLNTYDPTDDSTSGREQRRAACISGSAPMTSTVALHYLRANDGPIEGDCGGGIFI